MYGALAFSFTLLLLFMICLWVPPTDDSLKTDWAIGLKEETKLWIALCPSIVLLLFGILFRGILPAAEAKKNSVEGTESQTLVDSRGVRRYGDVNVDTEVALEAVRGSPDDGISDGEPATLRLI